MDDTKIVNRHFDNDYDIYIGRGSKWGNPFIPGKDGTRQEVMELYKQYIKNHPTLYNELDELIGLTLACSCKPRSCHGDILIELLYEKEEYYD